MPPVAWDRYFTGPDGCPSLARSRTNRAALFAGARVSISSPALIGGPETLITKRQRAATFQALPPGLYALAIELQGFTPYHEDDMSIGAGATIERTAVLKLAGLAESVVVEGAGSRIEARNPGFGTRFGAEDIDAIPTRRASMFDFIRAAPGISPTSPSSGDVTTVSAFGSGTNENQFLIDGTNFTCPCNGVARSEPGVDFIQEVHVHVRRGVRRVRQRAGRRDQRRHQAGKRPLSLSMPRTTDSRPRLTSQPVTLPIPGCGEHGKRIRARAGIATSRRALAVPPCAIGSGSSLDTTSARLRQPARHRSELPENQRAGQILRKAHVAARAGMATGSELSRRALVNPERPTAGDAVRSHVRRAHSVPAMTFGHLTHTQSANTVWDVRVGRFAFSQNNDPSTGDRRPAEPFDRLDRRHRAALRNDRHASTIFRTTAKATLSHYRPALSAPITSGRSAGRSNAAGITRPALSRPGARFIDSGGQPSAVGLEPSSHVGGVFITAAVFASDAITLRRRLTITAGMRFDHSRAISQDLPRARSGRSRDRRDRPRPRNAVHVERVVAAPRCDGEAHRRRPHDAAGELWAIQPRGVLTGELSRFTRAQPSITTVAFEPATGDYTAHLAVVDPNVNLQFDPHTRAPRTDEYSDRRRSRGRPPVRGGDRLRSQGWPRLHRVDRCRRAVSSRNAAAARRPHVPVFALNNSPLAHRRFLLTNPDGYSLTYNGLVWRSRNAGPTAGRRSGRTRCRGPTGCSPPAERQLPARRSAQSPRRNRRPSGAIPTISPTPADGCRTIARTCSALMGSFDVPRTGLVLAANLQHFSGKPWAATALVPLPQNNSARVLLEPRGSQRLSSHNHCSTCACRGHSQSASSTDRSAAGSAQPAQRHGGGEPGDRDADDSRPCSIRRSVSRRVSSTRGA